MDKWITVIVGMKRKDYKKAFLIAPNNCHINKSDEVVSLSGDEYRVLFSKSYVGDNDSLYLALIMALGLPTRVIMHKAVERVEWGDENEDAADTPCDDDSRSGSGDGDGTEVYG